MIFSYIIRTLNEAKYLEELMSALIAQDIGDYGYEIVVVDSGSDDDSVKISKKFNANVILISREDFTFGKSLNLGCNAARGDILFFISGHCIPVNNNWALDLAKPIIQNDSVYSFGKQIGARTTQFSEHQIFRKNFPDFEINSTKEIGFFCNNANSALSKNVWSQMPFDESLTGLEDLDLAKKLTMSDKKISYQSKASVYHIHEESSFQIFNRYRRESIALKKILPEIYFNSFDFIRYTVSSIAYDIIYAAQNRSLLKELRSIFSYRFLQYYGTWRGYHGHGNFTKATKDAFFYPNKIKK